ncbi:hypothetical protein J3F83DRAFT_14781 [Trichoderma novae-zelandiae]
MDKVTLLTSSRLAPTVDLRPHSTVVVVALLTRGLALPLESRARLTQLSLSICLRVCILSHALLAASSYAGKLLLSHAFFASASLLTLGSAMFAKTVVDFWQSRRIQKIRSKLFYEFAVFILGCGNALFLLIFWPGWLFLGAVALALWQLTG